VLDPLSPSGPSGPGSTAWPFGQGHVVDSGASDTCLATVLSYAVSEYAYSSFRGDQGYAKVTRHVAPPQCHVVNASHGTTQAES
jgi:hypothetical protein